MKKLNWKVIIFFTLGFLLVFSVQLFIPREINWNPSFSKTDKIPFGSHILFEVLPEFFPQQKIKVSGRPVYNTLSDSTDTTGCYIFINDRFIPDALDTESLLNFVNRGNTAFISAEYFSGPLADSLKLSANLDLLNTDSIRFNFVNPKIKTDSGFMLSKKSAPVYFSSFDTCACTILGQDKKGNTNFLKMQYGAGTFLLNTIPFMFTNYNILKETSIYFISAAFSYIPLQNVIWDEYYKSGKIEARTPLRYILNRRPLKWAYYSGLGLLLLFIIIKGRRRQRIIPLIKPPKNETLEFAETIGRLYYQESNHKNLAIKKITYFLERMRSRYYVDTHHFTDNMYKSLSAKTGIELNAIRDLFELFSTIHSKPQITEKELLELNNKMEQFL